MAPSARSCALRASRSSLLALTLLLAASALAPRAALGQDEQVGLAPGATVHPVVVEDLDGRPADLAAYVGGAHKPALFEFWATWCTNCAALEPRMRAAFQRHGSRVDFVVVAVGVNQTRASVKRHVDAHPLPAARVLWDGTGSAVRAFDTPATSYVVLLDRQGKVAYTGIGPDQDLEAAITRLLR